MLEEQNLRHLQKLRLSGMAKAYERLHNSNQLMTMSQSETLAFMIESELHTREEKRLFRFTKASKVKETDASIENIHYGKKRGLDKTAINTLSSCHWVVNNQHLVILGATGSGKTYLASAYANQAIRLGHKVIYKRLPRLLEEAEVARAEGTLPNYRLKLSKFKMIVLDDWGVNPISARGCQDLLEIIEDKTGTGSIVITSQLPINNWHEWLGNPTIADAILDRIVHRAHTIKIEGESMRKILGLEEGGAK
jgi:DNA replication protein DnaC